MELTLLLILQEHLDALIADLDTRIASLDKEVATLLRTDAWAANARLLLSIPGFGIITGGVSLLTSTAEALVN